MTVRAVIVEDEPHARRTLREMAAEVDWLEVVGEAADGVTARELIDAVAPDLVFLDVQLPELTGLEVLEQVRHRPAVVFTTAFDRHAVAAFEMEAIDYLVKPFGRDRFRAMLERVRLRLQQRAEVETDLDRARAALQPGPVRRLFACQGQRIVPLPVEQITRIAACDDYSEVHCRGEAYLLSLGLNDLESRLDPERFVRVHRSHIVNLDHVERMQPGDDRRLELHLRDGSRVVASRTGSQRLREMM
jgi:two-component system LytT family response regulator